jgi:hypothetical protein
MRRRSSLLLALATVLAVAAAWILSPWPGARSDPAGAGGAAAGALPATHQEVESLRRSLEAQAATLLTLTEELALLREEVAALGSSAPPGLSDARGGDAAAGVARDAPATDAGSPVAAGPAAPGGERPSFDAESLLAAGYPSREAERLRERWERLALDRLELNDRALREGWLLEPRLQEEHRALDAAFREEIGEEGYDAFLYATGQPNRVLVKEVIARSPASRAGVLPGDMIVSYDGSRTFVLRDLQLATAQGKRGELVRIEVVRDGQPLTLRVQRGPLGIILRGGAEPPRSTS